MSDTEDNDALAGCMGLLFMLVVMTPLLILARAVAIATIWNWYLPQGLGVDTISPITAFGISVFVSLFTNTVNNKSTIPKKASASDALWILTKFYFNKLWGLLVVLGFAWIGTWFL